MSKIKNMNELKNALSGCRDKLSALENKIKKIETTAEYSNKGIFEYYYPEIEFEVNAIEGALDVCEDLGNVILMNINSGFVSEPGGDLYAPLNTKVLETIKTCKIKFKEVECLIEQAQKGR